MNITSNITKQLPEQYADFVSKNLEIQFYYIGYEYMWRDGRFRRYSDQWFNKRYQDITSFISSILEHIDRTQHSPKEVIAYCKCELNTTCPYCGTDINLLDYENGYINNSELTRDWDKIDKEEECHECHNIFIIKMIQNNN